MKKFFMLWEIIVMIVLLSIPVLAVNQTVAERVKIPEIKPYRVVATSRKGIAYYKNYEEVGTIGANTELEISRESIVEGVAYSFFRMIGDERQAEFSVKSNDVQVVNEVAIIPSDLETRVSSAMKVIAKEGVVLHKGPGNAYTTVITVPVGTELAVYRDENYPGPWLYTTYQGKSGWICELNGAMGRAPEANHRIMAANTISIYADTFSDTVIGTVPASTQITSFFYVDEWSNRYYLEFRGMTGYVIPEECAWSRITVGANQHKVEFGSTKLYETASIYSKILINDIPVGTNLSYEFATDIIEDGWIYTKQSGVTGWVHVFATEEAYQKNLEEIQKIEQNQIQNNPTSNEENIDNMSGNQQENPVDSSGNNSDNNNNSNNNNNNSNNSNNGVNNNSNNSDNNSNNSNNGNENNNNNNNNNSNSNSNNNATNKNPFVFTEVQFIVLIISFVIVIVLTSAVTILVMKRKR